jgi:hypothetical protein
MSFLFDMDLEVRYIFGKDHSKEYAYEPWSNYAYAR